MSMTYICPFVLIAFYLSFYCLHWLALLLS